VASKKFLTIYFIDGSEMLVSFPDQGGNPLLLAKRIQQAIEADQLAIEIDGKLTVIPMNNVKYLQASPLPEELPETVVVGGSMKAR
jgi:hypothetical protein